MIEQRLINEIVKLVNESDVDIENSDDLYEFIGLILENLSGFESVSNDELAKIQADVLSALKNR